MPVFGMNYGLYNLIVQFNSMTHKIVRHKARTNPDILQLLYTPDVVAEATVPGRLLSAQEHLKGPAKPLTESTTERFLLHPLRERS